MHLHLLCRKRFCILEKLAKLVKWMSPRCKRIHQPENTHKCFSFSSVSLPKFSLLRPHEPHWVGVRSNSQRVRSDLLCGPPIPLLKLSHRAISLSRKLSGHLLTVFGWRFPCSFNSITVIILNSNNWVDMDMDRNQNLPVGESSNSNECLFPASAVTTHMTSWPTDSQHAGNS